YESEGELRFNWDFVAALFPAGVICSKPVWGISQRRRSGSITRFMNPKANCALTGILSPRCFLPA
ncbi:hypothetical protein CKQ90_35265, partial [Klebsiella pneumoniae]